jgi:hypothetical protein
MTFDASKDVCKLNGELDATVCASSEYTFEEIDDNNDGKLLLADNTYSLRPVTELYLQWVTASKLHNLVFDNANIGVDKELTNPYQFTLSDPNNYTLSKVDGSEYQDKVLGTIVKRKLCDNGNCSEPNYENHIYTKYYDNDKNVYENSAVIYTQYGVGQLSISWTTNNNSFSSSDIGKHTFTLTRNSITFSDGPESCDNGACDLNNYDVDAFEEYIFTGSIVPDTTTPSGYTIYLEREVTSGSWEVIREYNYASGTSIIALQEADRALDWSNVKIRFRVVGGVTGTSNANTNGAYNPKDVYTNYWFTYSYLKGNTNKYSDHAPLSGSITSITQADGVTALSYAKGIGAGVNKPTSAGAKTIRDVFAAGIELANINDSNDVKLYVSKKRESNVLIFSKRNSIS